MSVIWYKVWYDLWHNKVRTLLAVLSIAAGVFAVGAVFGMSDQLLSGMDAAHQAVTPSHVQMYLTNYVSRDYIQGLKRTPGVLDMEGYNEGTLTYRLGPDGEWKQASIVNRDDWDQQRMNIVERKDGEWPTRGSVGIERLSSAFYKANIGDTVTIKDDNSRERTYTINGLIRHPFIPPPEFGGNAVFFISREDMERYGASRDTFGVLVVRVTPYSADKAREVATAIKDRLAKDDIGVAATLYQDPQRHWGRMFVEGITLVMQALAVVSLLLSVVLVFNTLTALITQQTNQIGILKAIGGSSRTIVKVYLASVLAYGLLALLIALPLGMYLAWAISRWFLNLFNISYDTFQFSNTAVVLQVLAALAVPVVAALVPILGGARTTVREAIASYGIGGDFGSNPVDRAVERTTSRVLPSQYATAVTNMFRRKGRLLLTLGVLVTAGAMFLIVMSLSSSINLTADNYFAARRFDTSIYLGGQYRLDKVQSIAESTPGVSAMQPLFVATGTLLKAGQRLGEAGLATEFHGLAPGQDYVSERLAAGRWLLPNDGNALVLSQTTAQKNGIQLGDVVTVNLSELGKDDFEVVGLYQPMSSDASFSFDIIYAPRDALWQAAGRSGRVNRLYVRTDQHDESSVVAIQSRFKQALEDQSVTVGYLASEPETRRNTMGQFNMIISMLLALAAIVAIVGAVGLMGALSISVVERTKEIGVLRAIGARSRTIMAMFMLEGVLIGLLSWMVAVAIALVASPPLAKALGETIFKMPLDYRYNWQAVGIWLAVILILSTLASIIPARHATRISVRDSLAYA